MKMALKRPWLMDKARSSNPDLSIKSEDVYFGGTVGRKGDFFFRKKIEIGGGEQLKYL